MRRRSASLAIVFAIGARAPPPESAPPAPTPEPGPVVQTEEVEYSTPDGTTLKGFFAWDSNVSGPRPGIIVVHEWWGHNDYARSRAQQLAALGYTALAVDMYGDGKQADHPDDAAKFMNEVLADLPAGEARFDAALELLKAHPTTDPEGIGAIGYCFGGAVVLHMARRGLDLDAVASFHGNLGAMRTAEPGSIGAKLLVCHGAADPFVPQEQVDAFKSEMDAAQADYRFIAYEGAKHAFTNPGADAYGEEFDLPLAYDAAADEQSWQAMRELFEEVFAAPATNEEGVEEEASE